MKGHDFNLKEKLTPIIVDALRDAQTKFKPGAIKKVHRYLNFIFFLNTLITENISIFLKTLREYEFFLKSDVMSLSYNNLELMNQRGVLFFENKIEPPDAPNFYISPTVKSVSKMFPLKIFLRKKIWPATPPSASSVHSVDTDRVEMNELFGGDDL